MSGRAKGSPVNKSKIHQQTAVHEAIILILLGQHNKGTWLLSHEKYGLKLGAIMSPRSWRVLKEANTFSLWDSTAQAKSLICFFEATRRQAGRIP